MPINLVVVDGVVEHLALKYDAHGKPECRWTLHQEDNGFPLYLPCCAVGQAAERLAGDLEEGMHIVVTSGKLCYRKRSTVKHGEVSRMEVFVWAAETRTTLPQEPRSEPGAGGDSPLATSDAPEPRPQVRTPRDPKAALPGDVGMRHKSANLPI